MPHSLMGRYSMYINGESRTDLLIYGFESYKKGSSAEQEVHDFNANECREKKMHDIKMKRTHFDLIIE